MGSSSCRFGIAAPRIVQKVSMVPRGTILGLGVCTGTLLINGVQALTKGHDLSSAPLMEKEHGAIWYNTAGKEAAIEDILGEGGMDTVRLRYVVL